MKYLLDTNAWIAWLKQANPALVARVLAARPMDLMLCSVVISELTYGAERSGPAHRSANLLRIEKLRQRFASFAFDDDAGLEAGRVRAVLAAAGTPIGPNDLQIAAIGLVQGVTVVTHNVAEFTRVPGLLCEDWETP